MSINLVRVINQQTVRRSILIDKIDTSQGNFPGYAQRAKQKIYVPYSNPADPSVKGYVDLVPTDEVLLSANAGTIKGLKEAGRIDTAIVSSSLIAAPEVTSAVADNGAGTLTVGGTTFLSVNPDVTYLVVTNNLGVSLTVPSSAFNSFSGTQIVVLDAAVASLGTPDAGWKVQVMANSKLSNVFTVTV